MMELIQEIIADDKGHVTALQFSRDGSLLASSGFDTSIKIWNVEDYSLHRRLDGHENCANVFLFYPDDSKLISASSDATVRFWDLDTGEETKRFRPHARPVVGLRNLPDGKHLATSSYDKTIRFISTANGEEAGRVRGKGRELGHLVILDSGTVLMTGGIHPDFSFWSIPDGESLGRVPAHNGGVAAMELLSDNATLLSVGFDGEVKRWMRGSGLLNWSGETIHRISQKGYFFATVSPSEERMAVCINNGIVILSTTDGEIVDEIAVKPKGLYCPRYSPDSSTLAASGADRKIRIWNER